MPEIFLYNDKSCNATARVISFQPNPNYQPNTLEERMLHALSGELFIDTTQTRLVSVDATVSQTVNFGFGLLGSFQQGGTAHLERIDVASGEWKTKTEKVNVSGHVLLIRSLTKQQNEERSD